MTVHDQVGLLSGVVEELSALQTRFLRNDERVSFERLEGRLDGVSECQRLILERVQFLIDVATGRAQPEGPLDRPQ